jgi:iron complex outermembrane recepter protein
MRGNHIAQENFNSRIDLGGRMKNHKIEVVRGLTKALGRLISDVALNRYRACCGCALLCVGLANHALAADEPATSGISGNTLEEIVITATKREESLSKVPASIAAYSEHDLQVAGVTNFEELAALTPGVQFDRTSAGPGTITYVSIRGIFSPVGTATTGVYIDDTAIQGRPTTGTFGNAYPVTFDLNRVEVLRGPQGTLFGAGAEGGAVRFIYNQPDFTGQVRAEVAQTDHGGLSYETGAAAGGPIVYDTLGFRVSVWYRTDGGFVNRVDPFSGAPVDTNANRQEAKSFRIAVTSAPVDGLTITPSFVYQSQQSHDSGEFMLYLSNPSAGQFNNGSLLREPFADRFYLPALNLEADLGAAKVTSVSSYFSRTASEFTDITSVLGPLGAVVHLPAGAGGYGNPLGAAYPASYADFAFQPKYIGQNIFTQEFRLASVDRDARFVWIVGAFYSNALQHDLQNTYSNVINDAEHLLAGTSTRYLEDHDDDTQEAAFGQLDVAIIDHLKLSAGIRAAHVRFDIESLSGGLFNFGIPPVARTVQSENPITPKFGLYNQVDADNLFYASVSKGYRIGGVNSPLPTYCRSTAPDTYSSDSVWSYEIGSKNRLFDNHLQIDASAFHIDWKNIQQSVVLAACAYGYTANAGDASSNGFDLAFRGQIIKDLTMSLGVGYTHATFTKSVTVGGVPIVQKGDVIGLVPDVPVPWVVTLSGNYDVPITGAIIGYLWAENAYHSKNSGPFSNDIPKGVSYAPNNAANPATNLLNLRSGLKWDKYDLSLFIDNTLNSHPSLYKALPSQTSTLAWYRTFQPLTFGVTLAAHF